MARRNSGSRHPTAVDTHVGVQIREKRIAIGISQTSLAQACGITFQQVQKYEKGGNRVSASRLWQLCAVLNVGIDYFFDGLAPQKLTRGQRTILEAGSRLPVNNSADIDRETTRLARAIAEVRDPAMRKRLKVMVAALAAA